ncbi:MAG: hypothetical protein KDA84_28950, partial [Planctomycetaceae bacterium]|nr:hypothetical protein [Planctomycetaceae bacterium]
GLLLSTQVLLAGSPNSSPVRAKSQTSLHSLADEIHQLTNEVQALQRENKELHEEVTKMKKQLANPTSRKIKKETLIKDSPSKTPLARTPLEQAQEFFGSLTDNLAKLRADRVTMFTEIVSVELAGVEAQTSMKILETALANNLTVKDEKLRNAADERLRKAYLQSRESYEQITERVKALNAEFTIVVKKIEHLEKRVKEAEKLVAELNNEQ